MTDRQVLKLKWVVGQLRHAYQNILHDDQPWDDADLRRSFAEGLLSPQISTLEQILREHEES